MDTVSVIIPVHNTEAFLPECLASVAAQTYPCIEIILVDDASSDRSPILCEEFARSHKNSLFFRNEQCSGQGRRRNDAVAIASGKYLAFADSDDVPDPDWISSMMESVTLSGAEIAVCGIRTKKLRKGNGTAQRIVRNTSEALREYLTEPDFGAFSWNKLFRTELFRASGKYPEGMYYEDVAFIPLVCMNAKKIAVDKTSRYYYRQHPQSVTRCMFNPRKMELIRAYQLLESQILTRFPEYETLLREKILYDMASMIRALLRSTASRDEFLPKLRETAEKQLEGLHLFTVRNHVKYLAALGTLFTAGLRARIRL